MGPISDEYVQAEFTTKPVQVVKILANFRSTAHTPAVGTIVRNRPRGRKNPDPDPDSGLRNIIDTEKN